ncbi:MAG: response regulator, partial [Bacteroidota bacterium]
KYYYEKSVSINESYQYDEILAMNMTGLSKIAFDSKEYKAALNYQSRSIELKERSGKSGHNLANSYNELGKIYLAMEKVLEAEASLKKALYLVRNSENKEVKKSVFFSLSDFFHHQNKYEKAIQYLKKYNALSDSLFTEKIAENVIAKEIQYQTDKKDQEIALQKAQLTTQESIIKQRSLERNLLTGGVLSVIIILVLLIYIYNNRLKVKELVNKNQRDTEALRSSFFANISHEFRTPLTLISAPTQELMEKYGGKEDIATSLELINNNSKTLLRLINQLLDLSKLEVGKLELQVGKANVVNWIGLVASSFESLASAKGIQYNILLPNESIDMYFDKEKVELILVNILSNAFKFTPNGRKVEITASSNDDELSIAVRNEGTQIPKAYLNKIFDRFYQLPNQSATSGTGIGLALVKELTELHHGQVKLESTPNHTTFIVTLPCSDESYKDDEIVDIPDQPSREVVNEEVPLQENKETDNASLEKTETILLVEDNDSLRSYLKGQLGKEYRVKVTENGQKGFSLATSEIPDLIITDVMMPEMDGNSLVQALRKDPKTNHIPVIMLTAKADRSSRLEGISHGTDHYLEKPFDMQELFVRIQSLIEQRNRIRSHYQHDFMLTPANETIVSADDEFVENLAKIMEEQLSNSEFTIEFFASEMAMSRVQLLRKMKAIVGFSPSEFMKQ